MPLCSRCNWVVNAPVKGSRLRELITVVSHWLFLAGVTNVGRLQGMVWRNLNNFKQLIPDNTVKYNVCRHCLFEVMALLIDDDLIRQEFSDNFLSIYDFNSVIY